MSNYLRSRQLRNKAAQKIAAKAPKPEPTTCCYCSFEESEGSLIKQCSKCKAADKESQACR